MVEVVVLVGCSGAGKSSWALRWVRADPGGVRGRMNRDDLRASMFGGQGVLSPAQERVITAVSVGSVRELLRAGFSVVVDDTNLRSAFIEPFRTLAAEFGVSFRLVVLGYADGGLRSPGRQSTPVGGRGGHPGTAAAARVADRMRRAWRRSAVHSDD